MRLLSPQLLEDIIVVHVWRLVENYRTAPVEGQAGYIGYFSLVYFSYLLAAMLDKTSRLFFLLKKVINFKQSWDAFYPGSILLKPNNDLFF